MNEIAFLLSLRPIMLGLIGMLISGFSFPIAGVIIIQNGLIPMRYMLMHGVILGGMIAIATGAPLVPVVIVLNIILVLIMMTMNKGRMGNLSGSSAVMMVLTMGLASLLSHLMDVPAKDTLEILWGSPFALTSADLWLLAILAAAIIAYCTIFFRQISMIFFDKDIAASMRVNVKLHDALMVFITALIISVAMKMVGALLIDALVVLPVVGASKNARSLKGLFIGSALTGLALSLAGYFMALAWNLPVSGTLAVLAVILYIINSIRRKLK